MTGITSYGAYIPIYRMSQELLAAVWGTVAGRGEKAIANADEDSITMAVEAALDCLGDIDRHSIDGLYFASTTPPYREKQSASIIAAVCDLRRDIFTADFTDSLRAGSSALRAALDAVAAGSAKRVLVVASDCRIPPPNSAFEPLFGDGAAAFLVGDAEVAITIEGTYSIASDFIDVWRREKDTYIRTWEDRFVIEQGYTAHLQEAVAGLLEKCHITAKDMTKAVFYAPDPRSHAAMARSLGLDAKTQVQDPLFGTLGHSGVALAPMMLVAALEGARPGDSLLFASYGDGADAQLLRVSDQIETIGERRGIKRHMAAKMMLPNYGKYLRFRNLMQWEAVRRAPDTDDSSLNIYWRERKAILSLQGQRCRSCGHVQFPPQRLCMWCQTQDQFDPVRLSDKRGTLFTFSMDERAAVIDPPNILCEVDIEGGGRFYGQMTDRDPAQVKVGMPVEFTFRKIHEGAGFHNYYWRCRPIRC